MNVPPPFQDLDPTADPPDFVRLLARFPFERTVTSVHLHHTWRPRRDQWHGYETLRAVWYTHTLQFGWSDIGQHLTIAPDGTAWTGRDWNRPPCSSPYQNGTREEGPFMIALVGDLNHGGERFEGPQYEQAIDVIARIHVRFALADQALCFHRDLDPAPTITCPGDSIERDAFIAAISARRAVLCATPPPPPAKAGTPPFGEDAEAWYQFITICNQTRGVLQDEPPGSPRELTELLLGEQIPVGQGLR